MFIFHVLLSFLCFSFKVNYSCDEKTVVKIVSLVTLSIFHFEKNQMQVFLVQKTLKMGFILRIGNNPWQKGTLPLFLPFFWAKLHRYFSEKKFVVTRCEIFGTMSRTFDEVAIMHMSHPTHTPLTWIWDGKFKLFCLVVRIIVVLLLLK